MKLKFVGMNLFLRFYRGCGEFMKNDCYGELKIDCCKVL
jgi:hypothetical protein